MILGVTDLKLDLDEVFRAPQRLAERAAAALSVPPNAVRAIEVVRRSLDARGRRPPR